jgi:excisionase family DNA binding protein
MNQHLATLPSDAAPEQCYMIDEAAKILRLHPSTVRRLIRTGELRAVGRGKRRRVPLWAIREYQQRGGL